MQKNMLQQFLYYTCIISYTAIIYRKGNGQQKVVMAWVQFVVKTYYCNKYSISHLFKKIYICMFMYRWIRTVGTVAQYMVSVLTFRNFSRTASGIHRNLLLQIMFLMCIFFIMFSKCLLFFFGPQLFSAFIRCKTFSKVSKKVLELFS